MQVKVTCLSFASQTPVQSGSICCMHPLTLHVNLLSATAAQPSPMFYHAQLQFASRDVGFKGSFLADTRKFVKGSIQDFARRGAKTIKVM
jgi:hypothetical protein